MDVAVIGATGVLGRNLVPLLVERGYGVRALVRHMEKAHALFPPQVECQPFDLLADDALERLDELLRGCGAVVHAATVIPADPNAPDAAEKWALTARLRTEGVQRLLNAAVYNGVEIYVQQSITMAYPDCGDAWISEDMQLEPPGARPGSNAPVIAEMERMVRGMSDRLRWTILRFGSFVGPDTRQDGDIARLRNGTLRVPCDGRNYVSLVHVADAAQAVAMAIARGPAGETYNVCAEPLCNGEYYDRLAEAVGVPHPPRDPSVPCPPSWRCSSARIQRDLGWRPWHEVVPSHI